MKCRNCDEPLQGRYCSACGQDSREVPTRLVPLLGHFGSHATGLESKAGPSVANLLLRPGRLTRAYLDGRSIRFISPIQLYLWTTAAFFLLHAYAPVVRLDPDNGAILSSLSAVSVGTQLSPATLERLASEGVTLAAFAPRFEAAVSAYLPVFLVGLVAACGLLMALQFRKQSALTHTVFALHWAAFYFAIETTRQLIEMLGPWASGVAVLGTVVSFVYLVVAMHVVYGSGWLSSIVRGFLTIVVFALLLSGWLWSTSLMAERLA